jgi:DNA topoisomerase I
MPPGPNDRDSADPVASAKAAGLRYVDDSQPGLHRRRAGKSFIVLDTRGRRVRDCETLRRVRHLAIPPAWTDVWICSSPDGHIQATGRDARGRKQYRYHPRWRTVRDETKYARALAFARALPALRARVEEDLGRPGLPREKVLATVVRLLETTFIRVGNEEYARHNKSFGLTTLRDDHVDVRGSTLRFNFRGKGGKRHEVGITDRRVARVVRRCQDLPGQELFQYVDDDGTRRTVDSADVNAYLREVTGEDFTAKDFRTWAGTVLAALALQELQVSPSATQAKKNVLRAVEAVARQLGNTPAICRKGYVHPGVIEAYMEGATLGAIRPQPARRMRTALPSLRPEETALLRLLRRRLRHRAPAARAA